MTRILILGGTKEASELALSLVEEGHDVTTSLAGRTLSPDPVAGEIRVGGFGGPEKMAKWLLDHRIEMLIDATHPFAKQISKNAKLAAEIANIPLEFKYRLPWEKQQRDNWIEVNSETEACDKIPANARVLLALGSQHIDVFSKRLDVFFLVRMIDPPMTALPFEQLELHLGKPHENWEDEANFLTDKKISHIVCRNSGGTGAYAKIEAARNLRLPVIMIKQPVLK